MAITAAELNEIRLQLFKELPETTPHQQFRHIPPEEPANKPTLPDGLNSYELAIVEQWLSDQNDDIYYLTYDSFAKIEEYKAYWASTEFNAWKVANYLARKMQWQWQRVDAAILNYPATSKSADAAGVGADPPPETSPKQEPV